MSFLIIYFWEAKRKKKATTIVYIHQSILKSFPKISLQISIFTQKIRVFQKMILLKFSRIHFHSRKIIQNRGKNLQLMRISLCLNLICVFTKATKFSLIHLRQMIHMKSRYNQLILYQKNLQTTEKDLRLLLKKLTYLLKILNLIKFQKLRSVLKENRKYIKRNSYSDQQD